MKKILHFTERKIKKWKKLPPRVAILWYQKKVNPACYSLYVSFFFLSILNFKFKLVFSSENTICKLNFTPFRITKRALIFDKASEVTSFAQSEGAGFEKVKGLILKKWGGWFWKSGGTISTIPKRQSDGNASGKVTKIWTVGAGKMEPRNSQNVSFKGKTVRFRKKGASGGSIFSHASGHIFRDLVACIFVILALGSCENSPTTFSKSAPSLFQNQPLHFFKTSPLTLGETGHLDGFVKNHRSFIPHTANLNFQKVLLLEGTNWKFKFRTKERENKKYILWITGGVFRSVGPEFSSARGPLIFPYPTSGSLFCITLVVFFAPAKRPNFTLAATEKSWEWLQVN